LANFRLDQDGLKASHLDLRRLISRIRLLNPNRFYTFQPPLPGMAKGNIFASAS
jgi:hypothetical protein